MKRSAKSKPVPTMAHKMDSDEKKWRAEEDLRTLMRAEEIKRDRSRMSVVKAMAKKQAMAADKVAKGKA